MMKPRTGMRVLSCLTAAATILCASAAQGQTRARETVVQPRVTSPNGNFVIEIGDPSFSEGGLAGVTSLLYSNQVETGLRSQPPLTSPLPQAFMDDIPIPSSRLDGQTKISVRKITFALRRSGSAANVATNVRGYFGTVSDTLAATNVQQVGDAFPGDPTDLIVALPVNPAAGFVTQLVTFGDGINELFNIDLNMNAVPGFGTFCMGPSVTGTDVGAPNGVRLTSGVDSNVSNVGYFYNPNTNVATTVAFAAPTLTTLYMRVEGVPDDCEALLPHPWCIADTNDDGSVNVTDLLAVISGWGQVGPTKPDADVGPGLTGDCTVNVTDLLAVVSGWGACPTLGACCVSGSCIDGVDAATCAGLGGTFTFPTQTCANVSCPPDNDDCSGAFTVVAGANALTNGGATLSAGVPADDACVFGGNGQITRDVWYKYTTGAVGGVLDVGMCDTVGAVSDTVVQIFLGTCDDLISIGCNDDNCDATFLSRINESGYIPPNTTAFIRVSSWGTNPANEGAMVMDLAFTEITDDECIAATPLAIGGNGVDALLEDASQDIGASCQGVSTGIGRWFTLEGNGSNIKATTCFTVPEGGIYDGRITVYCGTDCGALVCVAGADTDIGNEQTEACPAFPGEEATFCAVNGQTYWIYVSAPSVPGDQDGLFNIRAIDMGGSPCSGTVNCAPNAPPANDTCDTAITAVIGNTPFSNNLAQPQTATLSLCTQPASKDVWFNWVAPAAGATTVTVNAAAPFLDSIVVVYTGTCAALTQVGCNDDPTTCVGCHGVVNFTAVAGTTYRIQVANWNISAGGFGNLVISQP